MRMLLETPLNFPNILINMVAWETEGQLLDETWWKSSLSYDYLIAYRNSLEE